MDDVLASVALLLLASMLATLVRVARGPTLADRLVVAQLFGTTGVTILLLLATRPGAGALRDVALVFALLALISVVAFVRLVAHGNEGESKGEDERR
jgi:multicomponent Na+:H+ antiporter subunit F